MSARRYARRVPSGLNCGRSLPGPGTTTLGSAPSSPPLRMAPVESTQAIRPLPATPNGAGTMDWRVPPATRMIAARARSKSAATATTRIGARGAVARRSVRTDAGSHPSGPSQRGRCRIRAVPVDDVVEVRGRPRGGQLLETGREALLDNDRECSRRLPSADGLDPVRQLLRARRGSPACRGASGGGGTCVPSGMRSATRCRASASRGRNGGRVARHSARAGAGPRRAAPARRCRGRCRRRKASIGVKWTSMDRAGDDAPGRDTH